VHRVEIAQAKGRDVGPRRPRRDENHRHRDDRHQPHLHERKLGGGRLTILGVRLECAGGGLKVGSETNEFYTMNGGEFDLWYGFVAPVTPSRNALLAAAVADATTAAPVRRGAGPRLAKALLVLVAVVALPFAGYLAGHRKRPPDPEQPELTRLTFRRGIVRNA